MQREGDGDVEKKGNLSWRQAQIREAEVKASEGVAGYLAAMSV